MTLRDPMRRTERLIEESAGDDVVIYDRDTDRVIALGAGDARLWRSCDGTRSLGELAALGALSETEATAALTRLHEAGLMTGEIHGAGLSRRDLMRKAGIVGGGVGALSLASILAPVAAHASTVAVPGNGAGGGAVVHTPLIRLDGSGLSLSLTNGVALVPGVIGTGFGPSTEVAVTYSYTDAQGTPSSTTVDAHTTDDGSFYVAGINLSDVRPGSIVNVVAGTAGGAAAPALSLAVDVANGVLGQVP